MGVKKNCFQHLKSGMIGSHEKGMDWWRHAAVMGVEKYKGRGKMYNRQFLIILKIWHPWPCALVRNFILKALESLHPIDPELMFTCFQEAYNSVSASPYFFSDIQRGQSL